MLQSWLALHLNTSIKFLYRNTPNAKQRSSSSPSGDRQGSSYRAQDHGGNHEGLTVKYELRFS